jgi:TPR repeat protein
VPRRLRTARAYISLALLLVACSKHDESGSSPLNATASSTAAAFVLSPQVLQSFERRGLAGDSDASYRVALHFEQLSTTLRPTPQVLEWTSRAAKQGNSDAMHLYAIALLATDDPRKCAEAHAWIDSWSRFVGRRDTDSQEELRSLRRRVDICLKTGRGAASL